MPSAVCTVYLNPCALGLSPLATQTCFPLFPTCYVLLVREVVSRAARAPEHSTPTGADSKTGRRHTCAADSGWFPWGRSHAKRSSSRRGTAPATRDAVTTVTGTVPWRPGVSNHHQLTPCCPAAGSMGPRPAPRHSAIFRRTHHLAARLHHKTTKPNPMPKMLRLQVIYIPFHPRSRPNSFGAPLHVWAGMHVASLIHAVSQRILYGNNQSCQALPKSVWRTPVSLHRQSTAVGAWRARRLAACCRRLASPDRTDTANKQCAIACACLGLTPSKCTIAAHGHARM